MRLWLAAPGGNCPVPAERSSLPSLAAPRMRRGVSGISQTCGYDSFDPAHAQLLAARLDQAPRDFRGRIDPAP